MPNPSAGEYVEWLWQEWHKDPLSVPAEWQRTFQEWSQSSPGVVSALEAGEDIAAALPADVLIDTAMSVSHVSDVTKVEQMIHSYRKFGHLYAHINPLSPKGPVGTQLSVKSFGLGHLKDGKTFLLGDFSDHPLSFKEIVSRLQSTYCGSIGADFQDIHQKEKIGWLERKLERETFSLTVADRQHIFSLLARAEGLESFLHKRYLGQKRFSLQGLEVLLPMLHTLSDRAGSLGVREICMGMAHRGRLNVLVNFMGKSCEQLLKSFEGSEFNPFDIDGDVKYHIGYASTLKTFSGQDVRLYLAPNPSHLESVNPVVEGFVRARQSQVLEQDHASIMPVLLHGDAAFVGQGVVAETLNFAHLDGYSTRGTIHIILNNQVGFTTNPEEARSCHYASDVAKFIRAPVLHLNADDPEACVRAAVMAAEYRQTFHSDIVLDVMGYRRYGHNEGDEPAFTQPLMYEAIRKHPTVYVQYRDHLVSTQVLTSVMATEIYGQWQQELQRAYDRLKDPQYSQYKVPAPQFPPELAWALQSKRVGPEDFFTPVRTAVGPSIIETVLTALTSYPQGFTPHKKVLKLIKQRRSMLTARHNQGAFDWATCELLAVGTLALEQHPVRFSGQDVRRGTFSSRHSYCLDVHTGESYGFLSHLPAPAARVEILNSPLSEQGCVGFEFGYAVADPKALVLWEAQFGDFSNGAQVIVDQFLAASEAKWQQSTSLVLLLPHGYEGQGPEHSNARPERYLQLCGDGNMQVVCCSTPAQHFHALRRQTKRDFQKCLISFTPKSLLRDPEVVSGVQDLAQGEFSEVLDDPDVKSAQSITQLILCTGKIYYEAKKRVRQTPEAYQHVALVRIEQLYPFPMQKMQTIKKRYQPQIKALIWMQEEPRNMGAWNFIREYLDEVFAPLSLKYVGRRSSGSTAEGSQAAHLSEQQRIIETALSGQSQPF